MLENPIDLNQRYASNKNEKSNNLLIKEMPYQVGHHFPFLASLTQQPILFLVRDPRHNIFSRIQKKLEAGSSPYFPLHETGWTLIQQQIEYCKESGIPFLVVNSDDFRGKTEAFTKALMQKVNLLYIPDQLSWTSAAHINLDNLEGSHSHLYLKVLASTGVLPPNEPIPSIELFPVEGGIRDHVYEAIEIYRRILGMEEILRIE
jgi:hypothetical protein